MSTLRSSLLFLLPLAVQVSYAQTVSGDDVIVEETVVTGTRVNATESTFVGDITVLDRKEIEARNAESVLELLRQVSGLHVSQYGGRGGYSSVFVQGAEPNFTTVLLDGVKVNDPTNSRGGSFNFVSLSLSDIERIEVVRGPQSSIYGSDALSGVISITTRVATESNLWLEAEVSEEDTSRSSVRVSSPLSQNTSVTVGVSTSRQGEIVEGNDYSDRAASVRLKRNARLSYDVVGRWFDSDSEGFPEDSGGPTFSVLSGLDDRETNQFSLAAGLGFEATETLSLNAYANFLELEDDFVSPGIAPGLLGAVPANSSDSVFERSQISAFLNTDLSDQLEWTIGLDYQKEDGDQEGSVELFPGLELPTDFSLDRELYGVFTEVQITPLDRWSFNASVRHDHLGSGDGSETTYRVGGQLQLQRVRAYMHWGSAFKVPSFFALGHGLVGNPDLKPETSEGWGIGLDYAVSDSWEIGFSVFDNEYSDLIDFDFELFTNVNRSKVDIGGFEISSQLTVNDFDMAAHLTYVDIDAQGTKLRQRPQWRGGINLSWSVQDAIRLSVSWLHSGQVFDSSIPTGGVEIDGYDRFDVSATWAATERMEIWVAMDNATSTSYKESVGFNAPRNLLRAGFRVQI